MKIRILVLLVIAGFVVGCTHLDWRTQDQWDTQENWDKFNNYVGSGENLTQEEKVIIRRELGCYTQRKYGWDNGCETPTPIPPNSPIRPASCEFSEWKNGITGRYVYSLNCE